MVVQKRDKFVSLSHVRSQLSSVGFPWWPLPYKVIMDMNYWLDPSCALPRASFSRSQENAIVAPFPSLEERTIGELQKVMCRPVYNDSLSWGSRKFFGCIHWFLGSTLADWILSTWSHWTQELERYVYNGVSQVRGAAFVSRAKASALSKFGTLTRYGTAKDARP